MAGKIKKDVIGVCMSMSLLLFQASASAQKESSFFNTPIGMETLSLLSDIITSPMMFFRDLHIDTEDMTPTPANRYVTIKTNFSPALLPFIIGNVNVKAKILPEKYLTPQVDLSGNLSSILLLNILSTVIKDFSSSSLFYSIGSIFAKTVAYKTRLFFGGEYSSTDVYFKLPQPLTIAEGLPAIDTIAGRVYDFTLFSGIEFKRKEGKYLVAQLGYSLRYRKMFSKIMLSGVTELGICIYPESPIVFHPVFNMQVKF